MSKRKNTNCLEGLQCKSCDSLGPFDIVAKALFHRVTDNGTDEYSGVEWDLNSPCKCCECDHHGCIENFSTQEKLKRDKPFSVLLQYPDWLQPSDGLDTYYEHTLAADGEQAVKNVQATAAMVNSTYQVKPDDFKPVIVLAGHCECEPYDHQPKE